MSSQESSPIRRILEEAFTKNIEHDGSYVPVSAIKGKFDQAEAALNAYVEERVRKAFLEGKIDGFGEAAAENSLHENAPDFDYEIECLTELLEAKHE